MISEYLHPRFFKFCYRGFLLDQDDASWVTVLDGKTGWMWDVTPHPVKNFEEAQELPRTLNVGGFTDWRTPNHDELCSLLVHGRYPLQIDRVFRPMLARPWVWSSEEWVSNPVECGAGLHFGTGAWLWDFKAAPGFVLAVRRHVYTTVRR